jgi:DNA-binding transcriptional LysR family regulator
MTAITEAYAASVHPDRVLTNLDLNLLVTLDSLLRERNLTRTAHNLGVSQPAISAALARLRRHFGDPLLDRVGNRYELTPLAVQLAALTAPALAGVRRVFGATAEFDPATLDREFTVVTSDYAITMLGPFIGRYLADNAPGVRLHLQQTTPERVDGAAETLRAVDGLLIPHGFVADMPYLDLYTDRWVCIVSMDNPHVGAELTLPQLGELGWVVLFNGPTAFAPAARQLRMIGIEPRVEIVVDGFLAMPYLVAGTNRIAMIQERLAHRLAAVAGVRVVPCPFEVVPLTEALWWHPMHRNDPAHGWLRTVFAEAGNALTADAADHQRG